MFRETSTKKFKVEILSHDLLDGDLESFINNGIEKLQNKFVGTTDTEFEVINVNISGESGRTKRVTILYSYIEHTILDDL